MVPIIPIVSIFFFIIPKPYTLNPKPQTLNPVHIPLYYSILNEPCGLGIGRGIQLLKIGGNVPKAGCSLLLFWRVTQNELTLYTSFG